MLVVADSLDHRVGGDPVEITLTTPAPRRSVYAMVDRQNLPALFRTFDFASPDAHSPLRYFTTVPQQALYLLNDRQSTELARRTADRITQQVSSSDANDLIHAAYEQILQRSPNESELAMMKPFLALPVGTAAAQSDPRALWSYGVARTDANHSIANFKPLSVFKKGRWQSQTEFPSKDANGHASLGKDGGHPGNTNDQSVVRRWQAPASGTVRLIGQMGHRGEKGDGVQATILVNNRSIFTETQVRNDRPYGPLASRIEAGQFVDLVASPGKSSSYDSFFWRSQVKLLADDGRVYEADSVKDFSGPFNAESNQPLSRLAQLVQVLMISNEFVFVD